MKGRALARRAPRARLFTLIVSDTNAGDEASVASGPTLAPPFSDAVEVVRRYGLESVLPQSIVRALHSTYQDTEGTGFHQVLLDNSTALNAAAVKAAELGYSVVIRDEICEQAIEDGCGMLLGWPRRATPTITRRENISITRRENISITRRENICRGGPPWPPHPLSCEISGGEFSCPVRGDGLGGRNLETALRCAIQLDQMQERNCVVLSAGTDGIDGNSPAAGAIADETTIARARKLNLDPRDFLARSDSYTFFKHLNDLIVTGPTGTNVRDLRLLLTHHP